jgi:hypothetical protein
MNFLFELSGAFSKMAFKLNTFGEVFGPNVGNIV